jgi:hypothetical protein
MIGVVSQQCPCVHARVKQGEPGTVPPTSGDLTLDLTDCHFHLEARHL